MIIKEPNFKLKEKEGCWNLFFLKYIMSGNNPRDEMQLECYQESYSLKELITSYKQEVDRLFKAFKCIDDIRSVII